jgi:hypothetical protein
MNDILTALVVKAFAKYYWQILISPSEQYQLRNTF